MAHGPTPPQAAQVPAPIQPAQQPQPAAPAPAVPLQFQFNLDLDALYNANKPAGSRALLESLGRERKAEIMSLVFVDFLPHNPMLAGDVVRQLEPTIIDLRKVKKLGLVLRSTGGVAEFPWKIVSILRAFCDEFEAIVPRAAMSGATHIAIAADNLVMGPFSNLGSVDPTRSHPLLPRDPSGQLIPASVQDLRHCLDFIKTNVPSNEVGPIVSQLFSHVNPLAIGAIEQSYELSRLITAKVLATRVKKLAPEQVTDIVNRLAGKYFSHGYPISRSEVADDLGLPITKADPGSALFDAMEALNSFYASIFEKEVPVTGAPIQMTFRVTGFLETAKSRRILIQAFGPNGQPLAGKWVTEPNS